MKPSAPLNGKHQRTYDRIFQHPISHNLSWHDVIGLFHQLGTVELEANENIKVTRNGQFITLKPQHSKDVTGADEVIALRHFLTSTDPSPAPTVRAQAHWLVVIDHHEARLFRTEMSDTVSVRFLPHEPSDHFRHAQHSRDFARGKEEPDPTTFFEPIAKELKSGGQILVFGSGTGKSSEMEQFTGWLKERHSELFRKIIGSVVVDESHQTEAQLLKKAREFYAAAAPAPISAAS